MKTTVHVEGLADLDRALGELTISAARGVLRRVGRAALAPVDQSWRSKAPVGETGRLHLSGGVGSKLSKSQRKAHERESFVEVFAGPGPHPESVQQEFGNINHPAQPFLRPAWDETKDQVLQIVKTQLGDQIDKAAMRAAKKASKLAAKDG